jgi:hypothetical protein
LICWKTNLCKYFNINPLFKLIFSELLYSDMDFQNSSIQEHCPIGGMRYCDTKFRLLSNRLLVYTFRQCVDPRHHTFFRICLCLVSIDMTTKTFKISDLVVLCEQEKNFKEDYTRDKL